MRDVQDLAEVRGRGPIRMTTQAIFLLDRVRVFARRCPHGAMQSAAVELAEAYEDLDARIEKLELSLRDKELQNDKN
jgi:hypothetical protein